MNKWTHFFIKIYLSHSQKGDVCCVWEMSWRWGQTAILTQVLLTIAALLSRLGWCCSTVGHWGPKAQSPLSAAGSHQLTRTVCAPGYIINAHLLPLFFHLFTLVHLLIDGLVEGHHITCGLEVSKFNLQSCCYVHFWTNILGKDTNPLIFPIYSRSRRMALILDNPQKLKKSNP